MGNGKDARCGADFSYQVMTEGESPIFYDMPKELFMRLTPLDDRDPDAIRWREIVLQKLGLNRIQDQFIIKLQPLLPLF